MTTPPSPRPVLRRSMSEDAGATAVEYGMLIALIAVVILVSVQMLGQRVEGALTQVSDSIADVEEPDNGGSTGGGNGTGGTGNGQGNNGNGNGNGGSNGSWGGGGGGAGNSASASSGGGGGGKGGKG